MQAMSLEAEDEAVEHNDLRGLMQQLEGTSEIVKALSRQLQVWWLGLYALLVK